jgi:hypothetical protein
MTAARDATTAAIAVRGVTIARGTAMPTGARQARPSAEIADRDEMTANGVRAVTIAAARVAVRALHSAAPRTFQHRKPLRLRRPVARSPLSVPTWRPRRRRPRRSPPASGSSRP